MHLDQITPVWVKHRSKSLVKLVSGPSLAPQTHTFMHNDEHSSPSSLHLDCTGSAAARPLLRRNLQAGEQRHREALQGRDRGVPPVGDGPLPAGSVL